jgi:hypothetical protein
MYRLQRFPAQVLGRTWMLLNLALLPAVPTTPLAPDREITILVLRRGLLESRNEGDHGP